MTDEDFLNKGNSPTSLLDSFLDLSVNKVGMAFGKSALTILGLGNNISASAVDLLDDGKLGRPFLENNFSAMYGDYKKSNNEDMAWYEHVGMFGVDVVLDPTTWIGIGTFSKVEKLNDALKVVDGAKKLGDINDLKKVDDVLKVINETKDVLLKANTPEATKGVIRANKKALKKLNTAENILKSEEFAGLGRSLVTGNKSVKTQKLNEYVLEKVKLKNNPNLITPENVYDPNAQNVLQRAFINDDVKLVADKKLKKQKKQIKKIIEGNYSDEIKKLSKDYNVYAPVAKSLEEVIQKGVTELSETQIKTISKKTGLSVAKSKYAIEDYKKITKKLEIALNNEPIQESSIKGIANFFYADSINEVTKISDSVDSLIKREHQAINKKVKALAKNNELPQDSFNNQIIEFIETGNKNFLNDESLAFAKEINNKFKTLHKINETSFMGNLAKITEVGYIPRRLIDPTKESLEKLTKLKDDKFKIYKMEKSRGRTTKDQSFLEFQKEVTEKGIGTLNTDIGYLIADATRKASKNAKMSTIKNGTKKYRGKYEVKGSVLTGHDELRTTIAELDTAENILRKLKTKIDPDIYKQIEHFNLTKIKEELPKLMNPKKAEYLLKNVSNIFKQTDTYYPKAVIDKIDKFYYKNKEAKDLPNILRRGVTVLTQAWKKWSLAPILSYHFNSFVDNANNLFIAKPQAFKGMGEVMDLLKGKNIKIDTPYGSKSVHIDDFILEGVTGGKYSDSEFDFLKKLDDTPINKVAEFLKGNNKLIELGFGFGSIAEDFFRIAFSLEDLKNGIDLKTSVKELTQYFYDPSKNTKVVRDLSNGLTPFASFFFWNANHTLNRAGKSLGRFATPLKMVNSSKADEDKFLVEDSFTDNAMGLRLNASETLNLYSKFSQFDLLNVADTIFSTFPSPQGILNVVQSYLGPAKGILESIVNTNFSTGREIAPKYNPTDLFFGIELDKRVIKAITSQVRLASVLNNFLKDSQGNFLFDTYKNYGIKRGARETFDNIGYLFLGSSFSRDLEKSGKFAIREAGEKTAFFKREMKENIRLYNQTGEQKYLKKSESLKKDMIEAKDFQNEIRREMPKLKKEQAFIQKEVRDKYNIDLDIPNPLDLIDQIKTQNSKFLKKETPIEVLEILDGDTLKVKMPNASIEYVRLAGINAPEKTDQYHPLNIYSELKNNQLHFENAKTALENIVKNSTKNITIKNITTSKRDKYNRPIVQLMIDDIDINKYLIEQGYATPDFLEEIENEEYKELLREAALLSSQKEKGFYKDLSESAKNNYKTMFDFHFNKTKELSNEN